MRQYDDPARKRDALNLLFQLKMKQNESVSAYILRFEKQMISAGVEGSNPFTIHLFQDSLVPELRHLVAITIGQREEAITSVKQTMRIASSLDWRPKDARAREQGAESRSTESAGRETRAPPGSRSYCQLHGEGNHTTSQCHKLRKRQDNARAAGRTPAAASDTSPPARSPAQTRKVTCFNCKQDGHYAYECPTPKKPERDNPIVNFVAIIPARDAGPALAPVRKAGPPS